MSENQIGREGIFFDARTNRQRVQDIDGESCREIGKASSPEIANAIAKMRSGKVSTSPGFDGEYGNVRILEEVKKRGVKGQVALF